MISTIIIFILILGLLVFVHEFGHFIVAKKSGMRVLEFGFGFPPRLFGFQKFEGSWRIIWGHRDPSRKFVPEPVEGQISASSNFKPSTSPGIKIAANQADSTIYSINAIPLGGFVRIWGENNEHEGDPRSFINRPFWNRFATLVAGVAMNIILAWILVSVGFTIGMPTALDDAAALPKSAKFTDRRAAIVEIVPDSPAQKAGLMPGDAILAIDGKIFQTVERLRDYIRANPGKVFDFKIKRAGQELAISVKSLPTFGEGQGPTGIALADLGKLSFPWYQSFWEGAKATYVELINILGGLYRLFTSRMGFESIGGPVKIAQITRQVADMGFIYLLQFTSFLSLNLAVLNILPFPALDGGRVLFLIIEKLRRKRNNPKIEQAVNAAGFAFLILLMILVTIKDVRGFGN